MTDDLISRIFSIKDDASFTDTALEIFRYQAEHNPVYKKFIRSLGRHDSSVNNLSDISFLPVEFFRTHRIIADGFEPGLVFESSRTTSETPGRHFIADPGLYELSLVKSFSFFYGDPSQYCILGLLPSYNERKDSSLVYMVDQLIRLSRNPHSGFCMDQMSSLAKKLKSLDRKRQPVILIGVSYALMDLAGLDLYNLRNTIIMETGGMKGRRKEIIREEMHQYLRTRFGTGPVHSEYSMTELLSQAYSQGEGVFYSPPWMKVLLRDMYDPLSYPAASHAGAINIIDLANIYSCSFIETKDIGQSLPDGGFKVLGRLDNSELRGCNLLLAD